MGVNIANKERVNGLKAVPPEMTSESALYDQRYVPRWPIANIVYYKKENQEVSQQSLMRNLTFTGCSLYTKGDVRVNDRLDMRISLSSAQSFQAKGIILWTSNQGNVHSAGVYFDPLPENTQDMILMYGFSQH